MAGKTSKTNVSARRDQRNVVITCPRCGNAQEVAMVVHGTGKAKMTRLCCEKAEAAKNG